MVGNSILELPAPVTHCPPWPSKTSPDQKKQWKGISSPLVPLKLQSICFHYIEAGLQFTSFSNCALSQGANRSTEHSPNDDIICQNTSWFNFHSAMRLSGPVRYSADKNRFFFKHYCPSWIASLLIVGNWSLGSQIFCWHTGQDMGWQPLLPLCLAASVFPSFDCSRSPQSLVGTSKFGVTTIPFCNPWQPVTLIGWLLWPASSDVVWELSYR